MGQPPRPQPQLRGRRCLSDDWVPSRHNQYAPLPAVPAFPPAVAERVGTRVYDPTARQRSPFPTCTLFLSPSYSSAWALWIGRVVDTHAHQPHHDNDGQPAEQYEESRSLDGFLQPSRQPPVPWSNEPWPWHEARRAYPILAIPETSWICLFDARLVDYLVQARRQPLICQPLGCWSFWITLRRHDEILSCAAVQHRPP